MQIKDNVINFIKELKNETIMDHSMNLFESGILTSLDVLDLISYIEETFKIQISEDDIGMESFGTINGIVSLIEKSKQI